jgi:hypothetical protein
MPDTAGTPSNASRRVAMASGAALLGSKILGGVSAKAQPAPTITAMPPGYNILFVLVDQEHFFPTWPSIRVLNVRSARSSWSRSMAPLPASAAASCMTLTTTAS